MRESFPDLPDERALADAVRRFAFLDQLQREMSAASQADEVMGIATRRTGEHLHVSDCAYADMDEDQDGFTIRGDWHVAGARSIVGRYKLADFGRLAVQELSAGRPLVINDNLREIAPEEAETFQNIGISATVCMPLVKGGRLVALMAIHHAQPHRWTEYEQSVIREITERCWAHVERVKVEAALKHNAERLRLAMAAGGIGTWEWDLLRFRSSWSERGAEIMGLAPGQELTPEERFALTHPDDRVWTGAAFAQAVQSGTEFTIEYRIVPPDGTTRWVSTRGMIEKDESGRALRAVGTIRDVTARREAQERLNALNRTLEQEVADRTAERDRMWRLSNDLFLVIGRRWELKAVNPAVERLLGYAPAAVLGKRFDRFVHPEDLRAVAAAIRRAAIEPVGDFSARLCATDGEWRTFSWSAVPAQGEAYVVGRDISAEAARNAELDMAREALRQSQKMEALGQLTGGVAHDFNNLLTPIVGSLDLLSRNPEASDRQRRLVSAALESAERARVLVQRLLAFARRQPLKAGPVDLAALVEGMAELIGSTSGPQIALQTQVPRTLPSVRADANQLEMAILNLAVNARDAMPEGGTLSITAQEESNAPHAPGPFVRLTVADSGRGMDPAVLARAIEPFFSTKGVGKGTGLGLSMVHGLLGQLGGEMAIESKPGLGTSVSLFLPVADDGAAAVVQGDARPPGERRTGMVLLVDDDPAVRGTTRAMLEDMGYAVAEAGSAAEARERYAGAAYEIVVSDHLMPGMTGADLVTTIKSERPDQRVLIVSGYADLDAVSPDLPRLAKPFRREELEQALAALSA